MFKLQTDASDDGVGTVLSQRGENGTNQSFAYQAAVTKGGALLHD